MSDVRRVNTMTVADEELRTELLALADDDLGYQRGRRARGGGA
jgi:hypothetical protein